MTKTKVERQMRVLPFVLVAALFWLLLMNGRVLTAKAGTDKWSLNVTDLTTGRPVNVVTSEENGMTKAVVAEGSVYHQYRLELQLKDANADALDLSDSEYKEQWNVSAQDAKSAVLDWTAPAPRTEEEDLFDTFSDLSIHWKIAGNVYLTSAVWHDVELEYQGGKQYGIASVWDTDELKKLSTEDGYRFPLAEAVNDKSQIVVWEYAKKTYTARSGETIEYYDRVKQADAPVVTAYEKEKGFFTVNKLNAEHPIAVMVTTRLSLPKEEDNKNDAYWFYYYTDGYVKAHGDFTLDYYNYTKDVDTGILTLKSYEEGISGYAKAALSLGAVTNLADTIEDIRYGRSKLPDKLTDADFKLENWAIPATYTDPYDGRTYQVALASNHREFDHPMALPAYPISAVNLKVDSGVAFPDDCSYLFYAPSSFSMGGAHEGARAHGWVGFLNVSNEPRPDEYRQPTLGNTKTFQIVGNNMADNVKNMSHMFAFKSQSFGMEQFDITGLNTSNVTDMSRMIDVFLAGRNSLKGLSSIDTHNAVNLKEMIKLSSNNRDGADGFTISKEDLAGFDTSKATDMEGMFSDCDITELDLSGLSFASAVTMKDMFYRDFLLRKLILPENMNTAQVTDMSGLFRGCAALTQIEHLSALDTGAVTTMAGMFGGYYFRYSKKYAPMDYTGPSVTRLDLSGFQTGNVTDMSNMFNLPEVSGLELNTLVTSKVTDMNQMFTLPKVEKLDVSALDTSHVKNMSGMFLLNSAKSLTLGENFDASAAENVYNMFTLDSIREWEVSLNCKSAGNLSRIFNLADCTKLTAKISGPTAGGYAAFDINAPKLVTLDLSGCDTQTMKLLYSSDSYSGTFVNCNSLVDLYLPVNMPQIWEDTYSIARLPAKSYLVGKEDEQLVEDLSEIRGDLSEYAVVKDGKTVTDTRSDRPVLPIANAILLRAGETNPVKGVAIKKYKRDADGNAIWNEEKEEYEYEDLEEITLYQYEGVTDNYSSSILEGYPNYMDIYAVTDPSKPYPMPNITWSLKETREQADMPVVAENVRQFNENNYELLANAGIGTAVLTVTAEGMDAGNGTEPERYTDTLKITVLPVVRADTISFEKAKVTMKPGDKKANAALVKNANGKYAGRDLTIPGATYVSSAPAVVEVDEQTGELTAKGIGTAVITATTVDPLALKASCQVEVKNEEDPGTDPGTDPGQETGQPNWLYLTTDNELLGEYIVGREMAGCIGTKGTLDQMKAKGTIKYDKASDTIILSGYDEVNLCIFKEGVKVLLKGVNKISGYGKTPVDGLCIDANCTFYAEPGASLSVPKTAYGEDAGKVCKLDASVTKTINANGMIVFAGAKQETGGGSESGGTSKTPAVGTKTVDQSGSATYEVVNTTQDASGKTIVEVMYAAPAGTQKDVASITVPETVKLSDGTMAQVTKIAANAFKNCKKLTKVSIGKNVQEIGANAFANCKKLRSVKIGNKVESIGNGAFMKCSSLKKITLPASVRSIGKNTFKGCKGITLINIKTKYLTEKSVAKNAFKGIGAKTVIKVPKAKKKDYTVLFRKKGLSKNVKIK